MRRGLAGLIAALLVGAFVALAAGDPASSPADVAAVPTATSSAERPSLATPATEEHEHATPAAAVGPVRSRREPMAPVETPTASAPSYEQDGFRFTEGGVCGVGHISTQNVLTGRTFCRHAAPDLPGRLPLRDEPMAPVCAGDGVTGRRVQVAYAYAAGRPDRHDEVLPVIKDNWIPHIEGFIRSESRDAGAEMGVRWKMPNCDLSVATFKLPGNTADSSADINVQMGRIFDGLYAAGANEPLTKYLVWFDGDSGNGVCGAGLTFPDETPVPTNAFNGTLPPNSLIASPDIAFAFNHNGGGVDCWGGRNALTNGHELFHTLGAVFTSAPNSDGGGHCIDAEDAMCYDPQVAPRPIRRACFTPYKGLDCNKDDYFNPNPPLGSYLSTHWNTAKSNYLQRVPNPLPITLP